MYRFESGAWVLAASSTGGAAAVMDVGVAITQYDHVFSGDRTYTQLLDFYQTDVGSLPRLVRTYDDAMTADLMAHWQYSDAVAAGIPVIHHSFKGHPSDVNAGTYDGDIDSMIASVPSGQATRLTYYHEPEDQVANGAFTAAAFVDASLRILDAINAAGRAEITFGPVFMSWTLDPGSGRNIDDFRFASGRDLFAESHLLGWDAYNEGSYRGGWYTQEETYGLIRDYHATNPGLPPPAIAETGAAADLDDLTRRGQWIQDSADYCDAFGCIEFAYFDSDVGTYGYFLRDYEDAGGTWHDDPDTVAAWQAVVATYGSA